KATSGKLGGDLQGEPIFCLRGRPAALRPGKLKGRPGRVKSRKGITRQMGNTAGEGFAARQPRIRRQRPNREAWQWKLNRAADGRSLPQTTSRHSSCVYAHGGRAHGGEIAFSREGRRPPRQPCVEFRIMLRITQQTSADAAKAYYTSADYYSEGQELIGH